MNTLDKVREIVARQLEIDDGHLDEDTRFETLGADSLAILELILEIEDRFGLEIPDHERHQLQTMRDAVVYIDARKG